MSWEPNLRYPDPAVEVLHPSFLKYRLFNASVERLACGTRWGEGPVWFGDGRYLLWSDLPGDRIMRWDEATGTASVFRHPSDKANGNTRDRVGRLITCEHGGRRVTRTEYDGSISVLMDRWEGKRLNSPNDVVCKSDGSIWFTDPPYGILSNREGYQAPSQINGCWVYRFDPATGETTVAAYDLQRPNGLAFSPDERTLYVADMSIVEFPTRGFRHLRAYDVVDGRTLANGRFIAEVAPGIPDGFRVDHLGRIFCSSGEGIQVFTGGGRLLGVILVPERVSNCTFGGAGWDTLYITATSSVYWLKLNTRGAVQR